MNKIPTTEELLKDFNKVQFNNDKTYYDDYIIKFAKHVAKLHVEAALKAASENSFIYMLTATDDSARFPVIDEDSILNAYPLENIK
jgi:hypothetical protein